MCAVASAPGAASARVWQVMSRGRGPRTGPPPPEGVYVAYPLELRLLFTLGLLALGGLAALAGALLTAAGEWAFGPVACRSPCCGANVRA